MTEVDKDKDGDTLEVHGLDVLIIGGGVIGCAIARELSKLRNVNIALVEKESDLCQGASKANSGIVHGGYDAKHGTLKSKLSRKGNQMFKQLDEELNFGYRICGSLVLAFTKNEEAKLFDLLENGRKNGVYDLSIISGEKVREMEPHASIGIQAALYCPSAGIVAPYEYTFALAENAMANGVEMWCDSKVVAIEKVSPSSFKVKCTGNGITRIIHAKRIVNCAGIYADKIAEMVGARDFSIIPRKGDYVIMTKEHGKEMVNTVLFQAPTKKWGKGILVTPTLHGNLMIGPSAIEQTEREDVDTNTEELAYVAWAARRTMPHIDTREAITSFAGLRARCSRQDFIIEESYLCKGFINVAGIESPGLTASPAIALMVKDILQMQTGLEMQEKPDFVRYRQHPVNFSQKDDMPLDAKVGHSDPEKNIICQCENITEAEIRRAISNAGIPIKCTDSIKWRTRAGMGYCQGQRCRPRVAGIILETTSPKDLHHSTTVPKSVPSRTKLPKRDSRELLSKL